MTWQFKNTFFLVVLILVGQFYQWVWVLKKSRHPYVYYTSYFWIQIRGPNLKRSCAILSNNTIGAIQKSIFFSIQTHSISQKHYSCIFFLPRLRIQDTILICVLAILRFFFCFSQWAKIRKKGIFRESILFASKANINISWKIFEQSGLEEIPGMN